MGLQVKSKTEIFKIPNFAGIPNVFFADTIGTEDNQAVNPIVGLWFRMEKGPESTPPTYGYNEVGVMVEGELNLRDESGQTTTVRAGDVFYIPRGSTVTFSSDSYGLAWKCGGRPMAKL